MVSACRSAEMWAWPVSSARASRGRSSSRSRSWSLAHPAARDKRPAACSRRRPQRRFPRRARPAPGARGPGCAAGVPRCSGATASRVNHQVLPAGGLQPVHAPLEIVHGLAVPGGSVWPRSTRLALMACPPQHPWALWIASPRSATAARSGRGSGKAASRAGSPEPPRRSAPPGPARTRARCRG